jgi:uncharacterized protein YndB with AHSA1/START domain
MSAMSTTPASGQASGAHPTEISAPDGTPFLDVTRDFDATPAQVFRAMSEPDLVARWLGPRKLETEIVEYDVREGGRYRYIQRGPDVPHAEFHGVFHSVEPGAGIVQTFEWVGAPGQVCLQMTRLAEHGGRTRMTARSVFPSLEAREAALASGMSHGIRESYERLDELVA